MPFVRETTLLTDKQDFNAYSHDGRSLESACFDSVLIILSHCVDLLLFVTCKERHAKNMIVVQLELILSRLYQPSFERYPNTFFTSYVTKWRQQTRPNLQRL